MGKKKSSQYISFQRALGNFFVAILLIVAIIFSIYIIHPSSFNEKTPVIHKENRLTHNTPPIDSSRKDPQAELGSVIQAVKLYPERPNRLDTLKSEVLLESDNADNSPYSFVYTWRRNNRVIPNTTGETLDLTSYERGDIISLTITPYSGEKFGFPVSSSPTVIRNILPTLELERINLKAAPDTPLSMQLLSVHPDHKIVSFSLVAPLIAGMTIDRQTGKITWILKPDQQGAIRFGAAVEDREKTIKVTKIFEVTVD